MSIQNRNYFFTPTVNNERFLSQDEPTEQVMRNFADSVAFKNEVSDTATETQQGLVETATQAEFDAGTDNNLNGWALYVRPSMIKTIIENVSSFLQTQITNNANSITNIEGDIVDIQGEIITINNEFGETMPLGSMVMYPIGGIAPNDKWMYCEGQTLDSTLYPEIFALIGYNFGGIGTNFSLPDTRKKFIAGYDDNGPAEYQTIGQGAGANDVTLTDAQSGLAAHGHVVNETLNGAHSHVVSINAREKTIGGDDSIPSMYYGENADNMGYVNIPSHEGSTVTTAPNHDHSVSVDDAAGASASEAHENRPEFVVFPHIIKIQN